MFEKVSGIAFNFAEGLAKVSEKNVSGSACRNKRKFSGFTISGLAKVK